MTKLPHNVEFGRGGVRKMQLKPSAAIERLSHKAMSERASRQIREFWAARGYVVQAQPMPMDNPKRTEKLWPVTSTLAGLPGGMPVTKRMG